MNSIYEVMILLGPLFLYLSWSGFRSFLDTLSRKWDQEFLLEKERLELEKKKFEYLTRSSK